MMIVSVRHNVATTCTVLLKATCNWHIMLAKTFGFT